MFFLKKIFFFCFPTGVQNRGGGQGYFWTMSERKQLFSQDCFPEADGLGDTPLNPISSMPTTKCLSAMEDNFRLERRGKTDMVGPNIKIVL